jgi:predicted secreted hydrolase
VLRARHAMAAHLAVARPDEGAFASADRLRRLGDGLAWASEEDLDTGIEGWTLRRGPDDALMVQASAVEKGLAVDLVYTPTKPLVAHGRGGLSQKGAEPGNASLYLSWTNLRVEGTITVDGTPRRVRGAGWFDHEWGSSQLGEGVAGWDWFSLRLVDRRDLMVYRLRRDDGSADPFSSGSIVGPDGTATPLTPDDFTLEPTGQRWTSPETDGTYPTAWSITVPAHGLDLVVETQIPNAEVDGRQTTGVAYYEAPVTVTGTTAGEGYMELTGYAGTLEGRF